MSWSIARIGGIDLRVHATFVLLVAWLAPARWQGAFGLLANPMLAVIALFVWLAAAGEMAAHAEHDR